MRAPRTARSPFLDVPSPAVQVVVSPDPLTHQFHIELSLSAPARCVFRLPNWIRGSYLVRDFAKHVSGLAASRGGVALPIERLDKSSFRVEARRSTWPRRH